MQVVRYFSGENLEKYALDVKATNKNKNFVTQGKIEALKKGHQNCVVMLQNGAIYFVPKVRSVAGDIKPYILVEGKDIKSSSDTSSALLGANHSSLSNGSMVSFAGSFVFDEKQNTWTIENTTGHYGTRVTQVRAFLQKLEDKGLDISPFSVKFWVPKDPKNPGLLESDYDISIENAKEFLDRTNLTISTLGMSKP